MAVEQLDSFLSDPAREDFKLLATVAPQIRDLGAAIVEQNNKIQASEKVRVTSTKELKDNIRGLDEETKNLLKLGLEYQYQISETAKREAVLVSKIQDAKKANREYAQSVNETTDAYKKLEIEQKRLEGQAKQLGAIYGVNSKQFKDAAATANEYGKKLKDIDAALGNHRRNVGNYASGFNSLNNAISQISRELPNFGQSIQVGILSLSNQWGQLSDGIKQAQERNKQFIAEGKPTVSVLRQITVALISWQTALNVGILLLTAYSDEIADFIQGVSKSDAALKKSKEESIKSFKQEESTIKIWKVQIDDATTSQTRLLQIKEELIKKYPGTKSIIEGETNLQDGLTKAIEKVSGALLIQARIRAYANAIAETETKQLLRELSGGDILKGAAIGAIIGLGAGIAKATGEAVTEYDKTLDILNKKLLESVKEFQESGGDVLLGTQKDAKPKREKALKDFTNQYISALKERNEALKQYDIQASEQAKIEAEAMFKDEKENIQNRLFALDDYYDAKNNIEALNAGAELKSLEDEQEVLLKRQKEYNNKKIKLTDLEHKTLLVKLETLNIKINAVNAKRDTDLLDNEVSLQQERIKIIEQAGAEQVQAVLSGLEKLKDTFNSTGNKRLDFQIIRQDQIENLREFIPLLSSIGYDVSKLQSKLEELESKGGGLTFKSLLDALKGLRPIYEEIKGLVNDIYSGKLDALDRESDKIKENGEKEIASLNRQALTAEEREKRIQISLAKTDAQEQQIEARKKQVALQQAKFNRAVSIAEIIANTAKAVVVALTEGDPYTKAIRAALAAALGAAQIARVAATPLPSYAEGTLDHPGGKARVGEAGRELVVDPDGKMKFVNRETIIDLPKHSKVFNEDQLKMMGMQFLTPNILNMHNEYDFERLENTFDKGINKLNKTLLRKNWNTNISFHGTDSYIRNHTKRM